MPQKHHTLSPLVLSNGAHQSSRSGCFGSHLASLPSVCHPSDSTHSSDARQSSARRSQATTSSPQLGRKTMVSSTPQTPEWGAMATPKESRPSLSAGGAHMASEPGSRPAVCLAIGSQDPLLASCDQSVIHTVLNSRAPSTRLLYANRWKIFSQWCRTNGEVPESCLVAIILHFLQSLMDKGRCSSTLKVYAPVLSAGHVRVYNQTVGSHYLVSQFLKGDLDHQESL